LNRIEHGQGRKEDLDLLLNLSDNIQGRTICALGDAAAMPTRAFVKVFREEFEHHINHKECTVKPGGYSSADQKHSEKMAAD
jgi:NADH-quinone oxidoreductase subunit F